MPRVALVVPGPLDTRTGGSIYDRRMAEGLRALGWSVDVIELDTSFPAPTAEAHAHAARACAAIPAGTRTLVDGLVFGALPDIVAREAPRLHIAGLIHLPLAAAPGLDRETRDRLAASERRSVDAAALVIVTGQVTGALLARLGIVPRHTLVVEPGTDPAPIARGSGGGPLELLSVGTLGIGKGHETLLASLAASAKRDWHLTCAGSLVRDPATVARVRAAVRGLQIEDRVSLVGDLDGPALADCYDRADLFVLATEQETYGMAVAEALARGLPVVSTTTGAIPALVGDEAGLLVPPGDAPAFADALARVLADAPLRARLAAGAHQARERLPNWEHASQAMAGALLSMDAHA